MLTLLQIFGIYATYFLRLRNHLWAFGFLILGVFCGFLLLIKPNITCGLTK